MPENGETKSQRMDFKDTPEETAWRQEVRAFADAELPRSFKQNLRQAYPSARDFRWDHADVRAWRKSLVQRGWIAPSWPKEYGGADLSVMQQFIMSEEFAEANAPRIDSNGVDMLGPTLIVHGTEEQKREFLPRILSGETIFTQGFTEPEAGSDLAALQTLAVRDGDEYVINGHKIWTTGALQSNWMFLLARTDPNVPKHRGISYFLLEMNTPGVEVRALHDITGSALSSQVFLSDARAPVGNLVGEENRGWYIATTTLSFERAAQMGSIVGLRRAVEGLVELFRQRSAAGALPADSYLRLELADRMIEVQVGRVMAYQIVSMLARGLTPNYQASTMKNFLAETTQRVAQTGMKVLGLRGGACDELASTVGWIPYLYLSSLALTIGMGTSEILRNVTATRGLGLPRG
jgi:alkylation response protein AidB-like acyl-CoA dehydrogenase